MSKNDGHGRPLMVVVTTIEVVCEVAAEGRMVVQMVKDAAASRRTAVVVDTSHVGEAEH